MGARAVRLSRRLGEPSLEGAARLIYGRSLGWGGSLGAGLKQLDRAEGLLGGMALGQALVHRSALLYKMGEQVAALDAAQRALELLPLEADDVRARALNNVGIVLLYLGRSEEARDALAEAERLHRLASKPVLAAQTQANRAMALAQLGDLVGALRAFDEAERELEAQGVSDGSTRVGKTEVLLEAGLVREAQRELPPVIADLDRKGMRVDAAEGMLNLAVGLVSLGDPGAVAAARNARQRFRRAGSPGWEAMAGLVEVRARWVAGDVSQASLVAAREVVAALASRRLRAHELQAQLLRGQLAEGLGRLGEGHRSYAAAAAARARGTVRQRATGWEALARMRLLEGNRQGALRGADAGLRVIERHRASIGAVDLRAGASSQGVELAALALRLALDRGEPWAVLRWAERWRAGALYQRPVLPPADPLVAELRTELRQAASSMRAQAGAGLPVDDLERKVVRLERALEARVRGTAQASGCREAPLPAGVLDLEELRASLGDRALVEYIESDGALFAVVLDAQRCVVRRLGWHTEATRLAEATSFSLRKLARLDVASPAAGRALAGFSSRLQALRVALVDPLLPLLGDRELVVAPTGRLHAVPWQVLVGGGRLVAVTPSAALWQRAAGTAPSSGDVVAVAGPGLAGAVQEVDAVRRHHGTVVALRGADATVKAVSGAIDGAGLVHLAAHGDIRGDSPLFSSFRLVDGPQTVYDLQCLSRAPEVVVLSACNSALSQVDAGDELLGLVASLLGLGTSTAIAAVLPISDLASVALMDRLHQRLAAGDGPGRALLSASAQLDTDDPSAVATAAAFVCLGTAGPTS